MSDAALLFGGIAIAPAAMLGIWLLRDRPNAREAVSLVASAVLFVFSIAIYRALDSGVPPAWRSADVLPGVAIELAVEPLGALFALIASFLWFVTVIYAVGYMRHRGEENQGRFFAFFALSIGCVIGWRLPVISLPYSYSTNYLVCLPGPSSPMRGPTLRDAAAGCTSACCCRPLLSFCCRPSS